MINVLDELKKWKIWLHHGQITEFAFIFHYFDFGVCVSIRCWHLLQRGIIWSDTPNTKQQSIGWGVWVCGGGPALCLPAWHVGGVVCIIIVSICHWIRQRRYWTMRAATKERGGITIFEVSSPRDRDSWVASFCWNRDVCWNWKLEWIVIQHFLLHTLKLRTNNFFRTMYQTEGEVFSFEQEGINRVVRTEGVGRIS